MTNKLIKLAADSNISNKIIINFMGKFNTSYLNFNLNNMENNIQVSSITSNLFIGEKSKANLLEYSKWAKFLAIMGYIGIGFMVLAAFGMLLMSVIGSANSVFDGFPMFFGIIYFVMYLVMAGLYYFPTSYLHKSADNIKYGIMNDNNEAVASGFDKLKSLFKFVGILTIIGIGFYVLSILVMLLIVGISGVSTLF